MNKQLLYKTQKNYLILSVIVFLVVAPLFYFIVGKIYIAEIDESLWLQKSEFVQKQLPVLKTSDISLWNRFNSSIKIKENLALKSDSIFNSKQFNEEEQEEEPCRELITPIVIEGTPYTLSLTVNLVESEDFLASIALLFLALLVLLLVGIILINKKISLKLWKPFYQTLSQIEAFEIDKNKIPQFEKSNIEEFERLNQGLENLIKKNTIIFENQREFVENAAHELQTPIAVLKSKIDLLLQGSDLTAGQSEILESVNANIFRITRLHKNLLLLSKIDKNQFTETSHFSINKIMEKQFEFFEEQAKSKEITIEKDFGHSISIQANMGLTEILLSNLLLNSIQHNIYDGNIHLQILENKLIISNTGSHQKLDVSSLFTRFPKINSSVKGNGLGLAIVKKIADLYQWRLSYSFDDGKHFFSITF